MAKIFEQNKNRSDVNKTKKRLGELVVPSGNTAELLDFLPKRLDQMTFFVRPPVTFALNLVSGSTGYVGNSSE